MEKERTKNIRGSDEMEKIRTQKVITFTTALSISERKILQLSAIVVLLSLLQGILRGSFNWNFYICDTFLWLSLENSLCIQNPDTYIIKGEELLSFYML